MNTIYFELDGKPTPANECCWFAFAPCGCMSGVMNTDASENGNIISTEEAAWAEFYDVKPIRELHRKQGFTIQLGPRADVKRLMGKCEHTPTWGIEKTPKPEGHNWAKNYKGRRIHLVKGEPDKSFRLGDWSAKTPALCGADDYQWDAWPGLKSDYLECAKCAQAAKAQP